MKAKSEEKKPSSAFDVGAVLIYGAAAFQAYHMGRAFDVYDPNGWSVGGVNIGGLILGGILNAVVSMAAKKMPTISAASASLKALLPRESKKADKNASRARAQALRKMLLAMKQNVYSQLGFYTLLAFSAVLIAPALYMLWSATLQFPPLFIGFMAVVGAVAPDVVITVGGFISGDAPVSTRGAGARSASENATVSVARAKKSDAGASDSAKSATESGGLRRTYPRRCEYCASDSPFGLLKSANAVGGHMKKHHPELCKPKVLADQLFSKVEVKHE